MRKLLAALGVFGLGIALGSAAWAQDDKRGTDDPAQKRDQDQDQNKNRSGPQTVRGVVAGITAEGELAIDYRTGQAVVVQAAYLTVVGSPAGGQEGASKDSSKPGDPDRRDKDQAKGKDKDKDGDSDKDRDNVYIVWLSPRTKVYEASGDSGKPGQKKEVPLSRLEIGDPVEIQFNPREQSDADPGANQSEKMRSKHGRERIFVGDATAITILPSEDEDKSSQDSKKPGAEGSDRDKDK